MEERAGLKIRIFPDPALRRKADKAKEVTGQERKLLSQMAQLMYEHSGIGLAGPQAGISKALIVADTGTGLYKLVNPKIVKREGRQALEEGCLSVPGVCIKVRRAKKVVVEALDENTNPVKIEAEDLLACVFQHEIDHLKGKLIIDYASFLDKLKISQKLKQLKTKLKAEGKDAGSQKYCKIEM